MTTKLHWRSTHVQIRMSYPTLRGVFTKFPKELFRANNGRSVKVRPWSPQRSSYDIFIEKGLVLPKALNPISYAAPNGASMRPNSPYQQSLVSWRFRGDDVIVYAIREGTRLPDDLLLVHERTDHYSLQPAIPMTLDALHDSITEFLRVSGTEFTRQEWLKAYPKATESSGMNPSSR